MHAFFIYHSVLIFGSNAECIFKGLIFLVPVNICSSLDLNLDEAKLLKVIMMIKVNKLFILLLHYFLLLLLFDFGGFFFLLIFVLSLSFEYIF